MNVRLSKSILILTSLIIYILPYKTEAETTDVSTKPNTCQTSLLSHESALSTFIEAIKEDQTDKLLAFKAMNWDLHTSYQNGQILLHHASRLGKVEAIYTLVSEMEIDVNIQNPETGWTALHNAVLDTDPSFRIDTIYTLLQLGADISILDDLDHYVKDREELQLKYSTEQKIKAVELTVSYGFVAEGFR